MDGGWFRIILSPIPWWIAYILVTYTTIRLIQRRYPDA